MRKPTITMSANASLTDLGFVGNEGLVQIGGSFGGGTVTMFISLDGGTVKNAMTDDSGTAYTTTVADTFAFALPFRDDQGIGAKLYATLAGSTSPAVTIKIVDNG